MNPDFTRSKPHRTKYGVTTRRQRPEEDRYRYDLEFVTDPPIPNQHPQWTQSMREWAIQAAGFRGST